MKQNFFKLMQLFLILITCLSSCQKEKVCGVENPLTDLPWLKEIKQNASRERFKQRVRIYQCSYSEGTGFLLDMCVGCDDSGLWLNNCDGEILCIMFGHAGDPCTEFNVDYENMKLLWMN
jgi:hypothetical protein